MSLNQVNWNAKSFRYKFGKKYFVTFLPKEKNATFFSGKIVSKMTIHPNVENDDPSC